MVTVQKLAQAGLLKERRLRRRVQTVATHPGPQLMQPEQKPATLKARMARQKDVLALPEVAQHRTILRARYPIPSSA